MPYFTTEIADVYGACPYGTGAESTGTCASTGTGGTGSTGGGTLVNTGFIVLVVVTVACLIAFAAILVRVWRKPKKAVEPVIAEDEATQAGSDDSGTPTQPQN